MNLGIYVVALLVCVALDTSLLPVIAIKGVAPMSTATLVVFIALFAPRSMALWAALAAGLLLDLSLPAAAAGDRTLFVPGPYALGFAFGTQLVLLLRSMVFRRNPVAVGLLTAPFLVAVTLVWMTIWSVRGFDGDTVVPWEGRNALAEFLHRLGWAVYSGGFGIAFGWLLLFSWPAWRFDLGSLRR